jgi:hypothetical protein
VRLASDAGGPDRAEGRLVHFLHLGLWRPVGVSPLNHDDEPLRAPPQLDEARLQTVESRRVAHVDAAMADSGGALDALGLCRQRVRGRVARASRAEEVEVVHAVEALVHEDRAVRRRL